MKKRTIKTMLSEFREERKQEEERESKKGRRMVKRGGLV